MSGNCPPPELEPPERGPGPAKPTIGVSAGSRPTESEGAVGASAAPMGPKQPPRSPTSPVPAATATPGSTTNPTNAPPAAPTDPAAEPLTAAERAELVQLRHEVELARLQQMRHDATVAAAEVAAANRPPHTGRHLGRSIPATVLIVIACILAPLSVVAVWAEDFIVNTDRYVATVGPLASNPSVQNAVTNRVTTLITQQVDIPDLVNSVAGVFLSNGPGSTASGALKALTGPITSGITDFIHSTVAKVVAGPAFANVWTQVNRSAHAAAVKALTGQGDGAVHLQGNDVNIDLAPVIEQVKEQLVGAGFGLAAKIPVVHTSFTLVTSDSVSQVKTGFHLLQLAGNWLPVITVLLGAAGIALALRHRNALVWASAGVAAGMLVLSLVLGAGRSAVLGRLPADVSEPAAVVVIDALLNFLWVTIRVVAALAVVVALGAYLDGPARPAGWIRGCCVATVGEVRRLAVRVGLGPGPAGPWVHRFRRWLSWVVLAVAAVIFALWNEPTIGVVLWTAFFVLIALAILEFFDVASAAGDARGRPGRTG
ncbi:MAG TPA: hypothetical protein VGX23_26705 [Actinocrinis sp.]|nr:hypothetical protein [Actinocrinis sp.]